MAAQRRHAVALDTQISPLPVLVCKWQVHGCDVIDGNRC
jgi:hypothetical protein